MLRSEFVNAWEAEYTVRSQHKYFFIPKQPTLHFGVFAMAHYHRSELDSVCTGSNRHQKFVQWVMDNYSDLDRVADREYHAMLRNLERLAESRHINTPKEY